MKRRVSAIVPAYGRERGIGIVLETLTKSPNIDEVICVYDGWDQKTYDAISGVKGVRLFHSRKRLGKAYAIARGIEKTTGTIILFIDADISGLTETILKKLIDPLASGKFDCVIGYRSSRMEATVGVPLSGERAYFKKDLISHIKKFEKKGYGLELYLNYHFKNKRKKIVHLKGVWSVPKHEKYSYTTATRQYMSETYQVIQEIIRQRNLVGYFFDSYISYVYFRNQSMEEYMQMPRVLKQPVDYLKSL